MQNFRDLVQRDIFEIGGEWKSKKCAFFNEKLAISWK